MCHLSAASTASSAEVSFTLAANVENLTFLEGVAIFGKGNDSSNNVIVGNSNANELSGFAGSDILTGNGGKDTLDGGTGIDNLTGGLGDDLYIVDDSKDKITEAANGGMDTVKSSAIIHPAGQCREPVPDRNGDINGTGNSLDNKITGNDGDNILNGVFRQHQGRYADRRPWRRHLHHQQRPQDRHRSRPAAASTRCRPSSTSILTTSSLANFEHVTLTGNGLNANGSDKDNWLIGNAAANRLEGGLGNDTLDGGLGAIRYSAAPATTPTRWTI